MRLTVQLSAPETLAAKFRSPGNVAVRLSTPAGSVVRVSEARPEASDPVPSVVAPLLNVTDSPLVDCPPPANGAKVAVSVTDWPKGLVAAGRAESVMTVAAGAEALSPVPLTAIVWTELPALRLLSTSTSASLLTPAVAGEKSIA